MVTTRTGRGQGNQDARAEDEAADAADGPGAEAGQGSQARRRGSVARNRGGRPASRAGTARERSDGRAHGRAAAELPRLDEAAEGAEAPEQRRQGGEGAGEVASPRPGGAERPRAEILVHCQTDSAALGAATAGGDSPGAPPPVLGARRTASARSPQQLWQAAVTAVVDLQSPTRRISQRPRTAAEPQAPRPPEQPTAQPGEAGPAWFRQLGRQAPVARPEKPAHAHPEAVLHANIWLNPPPVPGSAPVVLTKLRVELMAPAKPLPVSNIRDIVEQAVALDLDLDVTYLAPRDAATLVSRTAQSVVGAYVLCMGSEQPVAVVGAAICDHLVAWMGRLWQQVETSLVVPAGGANAAALRAAFETPARAQLEHVKRYAAGSDADFATLAGLLGNALISTAPAEAAVKWLAENGSSGSAYGAWIITAAHCVSVEALVGTAYSRDVWRQGQGPLFGSLLMLREKLAEVSASVAKVASSEIWKAGFHGRPAAGGGAGDRGGGAGGASRAGSYAPAPPPGGAAVAGHPAGRGLAGRRGQAAGDWAGG